MLVNIYRCDPDSGCEPCFQSYDVPAQPDWTVMDVLDYIFQNLDNTLAYFRHSICDHGICARCAMKINGKTALACVTVVGNLPELKLEPRNNRVVRDLVTEP